MTGVLLSAANWPIVGQIAWLFGKIINLIYTTLDSLFGNFDTGLVGISVIVFTIVIYTCLLPLTIKQQRSAKMTAVMNPEIQAIQKKYKGKTDQVSMMRQQEEMRQVYDKYGTSMMGGCLPVLIQMPFLFALYPVVSNVEHYVPAVKSAPEAVNRFITIPNLAVSPLEMLSKKSEFGLPAFLIVITAIAIPVLAWFSQFLNIKLSQAASEQQNSDNPLAGSMKTMNMTMPIFSAVMVFSLPSGIGMYWIISAVVRSVQQVFINKHLKKISVEDLVEKNKEKAAKKREKRGEKAEKINALAQANTKQIKSPVSKVTSAEKEEKLKQAAKKAENAKAGSLASKANMVKRFNDSK